ncbi:hypothetical protein BGZ76_004438, partial [Entomortierella beljakovae]
MSNNQESSPSSPTSTPPRAMHAYQQYLQQQQQQILNPQPQKHQYQHHQYSTHLQYQHRQQQPQQQQQHQSVQNLAVWAPSVPNYATAPASQPPSPGGPLSISGPLDLKTSGVQPILPPVMDAHPPPRSATPSRSSSLRRHPSQNGPRRQQSGTTLNQTFNNEVEDNESNQENLWSQNSQYNRTQSSTPGNVSANDCANSTEDSDKPTSLNESASHLSANLQRSNTKFNYSSPLLRSGSTSPAPPSPNPSLRRQTSILKNGSKDAPYLSTPKIFHGVSNLESLNQSWEPLSPTPVIPTSPPL